MPIERRSDHDYDSSAQICTPANGKSPFGRCRACEAPLYLQATSSGEYCKCPNGCPDPYGFDRSA